MDLDRLIEDSLVGSEADTLVQMARLTAKLGPRSLVLKPISPEFSQRKESLELFAERIAGKAR
jgi:hypothetical protein